MHPSATFFQTCNNKLQKLLVIKVIKAKKKCMPLGHFPTCCLCYCLVWLYLCNYIIPQYQLENIKFRSLSSKLNAALNEAQSSLPKSISNQEEHHAKKSRKQKSARLPKQGIISLNTVIICLEDL